jgi:integrase
MPKLTAASVACLKSADQPYEVADTASPLKLVVYPSGRRVFILRYRRPDSGKSAKLTLGPYMEGSAETSEAPVIGQPLTLASARALAAEALRAKAHGRDPGAERQAAKASNGNPAAATFASTLPAYLEQLAKHNRSAKEMSDVLNGFLEVLGSKPLVEIDADACHALIERCRLRGLPGRGVRKPQPCESRARLAHTLLQGFFSWCIRQRKLERSPMVGLEAPQAAAARDRVLDDAEIRAFWKASAYLSPWHCACLRLLLLTGQRLREISELRFAEIVDGSLVLSPERTKNKRPHRLPLSRLAQEILAVTPRVGACPFVFSTGRVPINGWTQTKERLDEVMATLGWNGPAFRIHDLRRTAASTLARLGVPLHVTEKILNHTSGSFAGIAGVYQRYSFQPEMAEAMEKLASFVRGIVG